MKKFFSIISLFSLLLVFTAFVEPADAGYVNGYYRSNGTYVQPYYRSRPNAYTYDNYSYRSPSYSNGYGYNSSSYTSRSYSSRWYTPAWNDYDYSYGYSLYDDDDY